MIFYEIQIVDKVTKFANYFSYVAEYEIVDPFLKIVHYPNLTKSETKFIALDTIGNFSIKEMEEIK